MHDINIKTCLTNSIYIRPLDIYNNKLNIGCVNIRSIRNKTTIFLDNIIDEKLDICMITET